MLDRLSEFYSFSMMRSSLPRLEGDSLPIMLIRYYNSSPLPLSPTTPLPSFNWPPLLSLIGLYSPTSASIASTVSNGSTVSIGSNDWMGWSGGCGSVWAWGSEGSLMVVYNCSGLVISTP